jgi:hypothetical protein
MKTSWGLPIACAIALAGCAAQSAQDEAAATATRFLDAVAGSDAATACALLAPRTREDLVTSEDEPCGRSLPVDRLEGTVQSAETWSDQAIVRTDRGVLFLTEFDTGWLVSAAGCTPHEEQPYRCVVGG